MTIESGEQMLPNDYSTTNIGLADALAVIKAENVGEATSPTNEVRVCFYAGELDRIIDLLRKNP